jgi:hypothetical protein
MVKAMIEVRSQLAWEGYRRLICEFIRRIKGNTRFGSVADNKFNNRILSTTDALFPLAIRIETTTNRGNNLLFFIGLSIF